MIREAHVDDIPEITEIYNDAVKNTVAIWNDDVVDIDNRTEWLQDHEKRGFPVLVADDGVVRGYAAYGAFRDFAGYRHTVEHSVYVRSDSRRLGVGRQLLDALIVEARNRGVHAMVAAVEAGNDGSIALHRTVGFEDSGILREVGTKFGRWLDLAFLTLIIDSRPE